MAVYKCKMCGASLEAPEGATTATCGHCRTEQTLPRVSDDRRANLYDRAGHFRRANEYDKAMRLYEQVLADDPTDAEAYWSVVLCRYGVEYVEDPATRRRVPTVNRMQTSSVLADPDYRQALEHADVAQRGIYEREARAISAVQEGISEVAAREEPYDVFVCYKETDAQGRRTRDSVLATELYQELTREGFRVFLSRVTLEDKLGTAYEPYIFAALQSARVMVALGTRPEHFEAVWVKNEWSRYLALIRGGADKVLIPAYRDMDPYDLPEEFAHLQAQDMGRLGFMQDLVRGISKIVRAGSGGTSEAAPAAERGREAAGGGGSNASALLDRAQMALEDGEWGRADAFCEQVLNSDARNATAYLYKLMAALKVRTPEGLGKLRVPFDGNPDYQRAVRFGDDGLRSMLEGANGEARRAEAYDAAAAAAKNAATEEEFEAAARMFDRLGDYGDAASKAQEARRAWARIEAVAEDIVRSYAESGAQAAKTELERLRERETQLLTERATGPALLRQATESQQSAADLERQLAQLQARRGALGVFAFAERREADREIASVEARLDAARTAAQEAQSRARAARSAPAVDADLRECERMIAAEEEAERRRASLGVGEVRHAEADLDDPRVLAQIKRAHPKETFLLGLLGIGGSWRLGRWGGEPIEWRTIARQGRRVLAVTVRAIDCRRFDPSSNRWEASELKRWLEGEFERGAFDDAERRRLASHPFCLSVEEARQHFRDDEDRRCEPSALAVRNGAKTYFGSCNCSWWLRSSVGGSYRAAYVTDYGSFDPYGHGASEDYIAVRPALWLTL